MLSNYFSPLNFITLTEYVLIFLFFDVFGTFIRNLIFNKTNLVIGRILNWLIGLGFFVFIWFILSLFVPYTQLNLLISFFVLFVISIISYLKKKEYTNLFKELWNLRFPLLIIAPFLPAVFVKASLPPYYADEMAYHFISPYTVENLGAIKYIGGLYADLPRIMNLFYEIIFSLTKTYSIARLFHFSILATSMLYAYSVLKNNFGFLAGFLFVFGYFSIPQDTVLVATLGYIDVAAYSFLLIALISTISYLKKPEEQSLLLLVMFWAMNLGTKYTGVSSFAAFLLVLCVLFFGNKKRYFKLINRKLIIKAALLFLSLGGYWYMKNFILYGNPIFPFVFPCLWGNYVEHCPAANGAFFSGWTTEIKLSNAYLILSQLFINSKILQLMVLITPILAVLSKNKTLRVIAVMSFITVIAELLILKYFSGFYIRYQQHMQLFLLLGIVLVVTAKYKNVFLSLLAKIFIVFILLSSIFLYVRTVKHTNSLGFLNWNEINYSIGKMDIYDWVDFYFPRMKYTIRWCEQSENNKPKLLARYDPDLIWFEYDGLKRVFLINCIYQNPSFGVITPENILDDAKSKKLQFWIASLDRCVLDSNVIKKHPTERDDMLELRKFNNKIICNSKEVEPNLYYFDYKTIK